MMQPPCQSLDPPTLCNHMYTLALGTQVAYASLAWSVHTVTWHTGCIAESAWVLHTGSAVRVGSSRVVAGCPGRWGGGDPSRWSGAWVQAIKFIESSFQKADIPKLTSHVKAECLYNAPRCPRIDQTTPPYTHVWVRHRSGF